MGTQQCPASARFCHGNDEDALSVDHSPVLLGPVGDQLLAGAHEYLFRCRGRASVERQPPGVSSRSELKIAQEGNGGSLGGNAVGLGL